MIESNNERCIIGNLYNPLILHTQPELIQNTVNICIYCQNCQICNKNEKNTIHRQFELQFKRDFSDILPQIIKLSENILSLQMIESFKQCLYVAYNDYQYELLSNKFRQWVKEQMNFSLLNMKEGDATHG